MIEVKDLYSQAFHAQRHASDYRAKIIGAWGAMYTAFAGVFLWVQSNNRALLWTVTLAAAVMTVMMWLADIRNRPAIKRAKEIGEHIEKAPESQISEELRFFATLDQGVRHGWIIDIFALVTLGMFLGGLFAL